MSKTISPGILSSKRALVDIGPHADRGGVNHDIEMAQQRLIVRRSVSPPTRAGEGANTIRIAAGERDFGASVGQRAGRAARRAAIADNQHGGLGKLDQFRERPETASASVLVRAICRLCATTVFTAPMRLRQRIHMIEIAHDAALVGMVTLKPDERKILGELEKIAQLIRVHQQRHIDRIDAPRLKRAVVDVRRNRMPDRVRNHAQRFSRLS